MSFVSDALGSVGDAIGGLVGGIFGADDQADAAQEAAAAQVRASDKAIKAQQKALKQTRRDLAPFRRFGKGALGTAGQNLRAVSDLVNNPQAQVDFIQNNPFFDLLADDAQRRIFNQAGAMGKKGSGGTAQALQNSIMLLGNDLVNQQVNRGLGVTGAAQNAVTIGANAASRTGSATQNAAANIGNLVTGAGNARAAGIIGAGNAQNAAVQQAVDLGLGIGSIGAMGGFSGFGGGGAIGSSGIPINVPQTILGLG